MRLERRRVLFVKMLRYDVVYYFLGIVCVVGSGAPMVEKRSLYPVEARPLIIKSYPAVEDYQSDLYEVYAQPYPYVSI